MKSAVLSQAFGSLGVLLVACSTARPHYEVHLDDRPALVPEQIAKVGAEPAPPPVRKVITPAEHAAQFERGVACEVEARKILGGDRDYAWALLTECAKKKDFTDIYRVLSENWLEELKRRRAGGVKLVARVIANRGGDMSIDLKHVNQYGLQIFRLQDAMESPDIFRGRYILMRGTLVKREPGQKAERLRLAEMALESENIKASYGAAWGTLRSQGRNMSYHNRNYRGDRKAVIGSRNIEQETGRDVVGWFEGDAQGLKEGKDYIFLIRFEELQPSSGTDEFGLERQIGVAAVVDYFEPAPE